MLHLIEQHRQMAATAGSGAGSSPNVDLFNQPNLERALLRSDRGHGTRRFAANQISIATMWQSIENDDNDDSGPNGGGGGDRGQPDVRVRNHRRWLRASGVDVPSSVQMMFDIFAQSIEVGRRLGLENIEGFGDVFYYHF